MTAEIVVIIVLIILIITKLSVVFGKKQCESKASLVGKVVIVTGANSGIGFETAKDLAARGGRVILGCRSETRALAARERIIKETGNTNVIYKHLDLSSLDSVRRFAENVSQTESRLDVLINNAGAHASGNRHTADGIVTDMQINYFGAFLLTLLLLPLLKKTGASRIVNLNSTLHFLGRVNTEFINKEGYYSDLWLYANSKLCIVLFTVELARRLKGSGVTVNTVHPGVIMTNISAKSDVMTRLAFAVLCWICSRSAAEGAQTVIYLAVADECANITGKYFTDCKETWMTWKSRDRKLAADLWYYSQKLVGYEEEIKKQI